MKFDVLEKIRHILFTTKCLFCDEVLYYNQVVCDKCNNILEKLDYSKCSCCGNVDCSCNGKFFFSYVISPFVYEDIVKDAIIDMKFNGIGYNAKGFSEFILDCIYNFKFKSEIDILVEVPMYYKNRRFRGYNQSELLAKYLSKEMNLKYYKKIITKIRQTKEQNKLNYNQRKVNLLDCYRIFDNSKIKGKTVLLIDDVFTTGSTTNECSKVLLENGAKKVFVATCCIVKNNV